MVVRSRTTYASLVKPRITILCAASFRGRFFRADGRDFVGLGVGRSCLRGTDSGERGGVAGKGGRGTRILVDRFLAERTGRGSAVRKIARGARSAQQIGEEGGSRSGSSRGSATMRDNRTRTRWRVCSMSASLALGGKGAAVRRLRKRARSSTCVDPPPCASSTENPNGRSVGAAFSARARAARKKTKKTRCEKWAHTSTNRGGVSAEDRPKNAGAGGGGGPASPRGRFVYPWEAGREGARDLGDVALRASRE